MSRTLAGASRNLKFVVLAGAVLVLAAQAAIAQDDTTSQQQPTSSGESGKILSYRGEIGSFGELYSISGQPARRPGSSGRIYLRSTLTAFSSISASLNLLLSTEGNSARQEINQFDFNPRWSWGEAHVGDFTEEYSSLTLSGIRVRGGSLMLSPGRLRLGLLYGMTNRSVGTAGGDRSYERTVAGVALGVGRIDGTSFDLFVVNARDQISSLAELTIDSTATDTAWDTLGQNPTTVTPQENIVVSTVTNLALFGQTFRWRTEAAAAAITRDRRSPELDDSDVPDFLIDLFTPRKSSRADYACLSDLSLNFGKLTLTSGFHYIGPGYVSLGLSSLAADKQEVTAGLTWRHTRGMVRLDGAMQRDNLVHQKLFTTDRQRVNSLVSYRLRRNWNATAGVIYTGMANDAPTDTTRLDYVNWIYRTGQQLTFGRQRGLRTVTLDLINQHASDKNRLRQSSRTNSTSGTVTAGFGVTSSLELTTSTGLISSRVGSGGRQLSQTYSLAARHAAFARRLTTNLTMSVAVGEITTTLRPSLVSTFHAGPETTITVELESTLLRGGPADGHFSEYAGRLLLARRF